MKGGRRRMEEGFVLEVNESSLSDHFETWIAGTFMDNPEDV